MKTKQVYEGRPYRVGRFHYIACCDCSLVHTMQLRKVGREFEVTVWREPGLTRKGRRAKRFRGVRVAKGE